ncbi:MAG: cytochrome P460 family protein [Myxococcota bacterium]
MLALALLACEEEESVSFAAEDLDAELEDYEAWAQPPDWTGVRPSCDADHGEYVQLWLNAVALDDVEADRETFSEGAIFVIEGYQDEGLTVKGLDAIRKVPGYDPDNGDWFWGHYDEDHAPVATGRVTGCVGCHESGRDHVRFLGSAVVDSRIDCP